MVMVANKKSQDQMTEDLSLFLGNNTIRFTVWYVSEYLPLRAKFGTSQSRCSLWKEAPDRRVRFSVERQVVSTEHSLWSQTAKVESWSASCLGFSVCKMWIVNHLYRALVRALSELTHVMCSQLCPAGSKYLVYVNCSYCVSLVNVYILSFLSSSLNQLQVFFWTGLTS